MSLFDKIELLDSERKIRITYAINNNTVGFIIVNIEDFFKELEKEQEKTNIFNKIIRTKRNLLN